MDTFQKLTFINNTIPNIIKAFEILGIDQVRAPQGQTNFYLNKEKTKIQFCKESFDDDHYTEEVGDVYFNTDPKKVDIIFESTQFLLLKIKNDISNVISEMSSFNTKLTSIYLTSK